MTSTRLRLFVAAALLCLTSFKPVIAGEDFPAFLVRTVSAHEEPILVIMSRLKTSLYARDENSSKQRLLQLVEQASKSSGAGSLLTGSPASRSFTRTLRSSIASMDEPIVKDKFVRAADDLIPSAVVGSILEEIRRMNPTPTEQQLQLAEQGFRSAADRNKAVRRWNAVRSAIDLRKDIEAAEGSLRTLQSGADVAGVAAKKKEMDALVRTTRIALAEARAEELERHLRMRKELDAVRTAVDRAAKLVK